MKDASEKLKQAETKPKPETVEPESKDNSQEKSANLTDIELLKAMTEKYDLTILEKKAISKIISLLETQKMRQMLPPQNIGDSVFKMYSSDGEPTEFLVDRVEFDNYGWNLVSYEKFGTSEVEFVFPERDYNKYFFDTAEDARASVKKK